MDLDNERRSGNFEDRGRGAGGGGGGGIGGYALFGLFRLLGLRGIIILALVVGGLYLFVPGFRPLISGITGGGPVQSSGQTCSTNQQACVFIQRVLASTEDVWHQQFRAGRLPQYGQALPSDYTEPKLVVFSDAVQTGCGNASTDAGPFYCPQDHQVYLDPTFYNVLQQRLHSPGDFAQAYVVAHEIGHHVQNLIGAMNAGPRDDTQNQHSVRVELQADCFAGVWGKTEQSALHIDQTDLQEALTAAHNIGDDQLQEEARGGVDPTSYTHGTSEQRMRWFRRGFDSGDARQCDTMQGSYDQL
jgi:predicted metalloprotease